jgi:asparagine synthase (glutamine-hydrolysing)
MMDRVEPKYILGMNKTYNFETRYQKVKNLLHAKTIIEALKYTSQQFTCKEVRKLLRHDINALRTNFDVSVAKHNDAMNQMLAVYYKVYMADDILTKVDRAAMSVSLEGREPLLDYRIAEFVAQLPSNLKYRDGTAKWILKEITHKYVPKPLMDRPKMGFGVPITEWFKDALKEYFIIYLNKERLEREGVFNADEVVKLRDQYLRGNRENIERLWAILMFEMWYERWM